MRARARPCAPVHADRRGAQGVEGEQTGAGKDSGRGQQQQGHRHVDLHQADDHADDAKPADHAGDEDPEEAGQESTTGPCKTRGPIVQGLKEAGAIRPHRIRPTSVSLMPMNSETA